MYALKNINHKLQKLYLGHKYKEYRSLLIKNKLNFSLDDFYYNLGTIDLKLNHLGLARYHLENSIAKGRLSADVYNNLKVVKERLQISNSNNNSNNNNYYSLKSKIIFLSKKMPSDSWISISLFILIFCIIILKIKKIYKFKYFIICLLLSTFPILFNNFFVIKKVVGISLKEVEYREGPTTIFSVFGNIPAGQKILLGKHIGHWWLVEYPPKYVGWINSSNIGFL